jgi:ferric-dicitrate binding protein FerR (iron transport regulator)
MAHVQGLLDAEEFSRTSGYATPTSGECHDPAPLEPETRATAAPPSPARMTSTDCTATTARSVLTLILRANWAREFRLVRGIEDDPMTYLRRLLIVALVLLPAALVWLAQIHSSSLTWLAKRHLPSLTRNALAVNHCAPFGDHTSVRLPDNTRVELNSETCVIALYSTTIRQVQLESGEAIFEVAHDPVRPFVVQTGPVSVGVLGTTFDVYKRADSTRVSVIEGTVQISRRLKPREPITALTDLQQIDVPDDITQPTIRRSITKDDIDRVTAWVKGRIVLSDQTLKEIFEEFSRYQDVHVVLKDPSILHARLSGSFRTSDLEGLMTRLSGQCIHGEYDKVAQRITLSSEMRWLCLKTPLELSQDPE